MEKKMCNEDRYFIDSHCHLFSESDISILEIFERASRSAAGLLPITIINGYLDWKSPQFKKFFKTTTEKNIIEIIDKINGIKNPDLSCRKKILVPLMLDMEISEPYHPLKYQVNRLKDAITSFDEKYAENDVKILPFIGLDMERFNCDSSPEDVIKEVLDRSDLSFFMGEDRKAHNNLRNGDIIGIKLYPSLGFNPCPAAGEVKDKYMNAYKYFAQNEIPITIHCQKDSLLAGEKEKDELESYNDPRCWIEMLNAEKDLENIRINFAHFGGDTDVAQTIRFQKRSSDGSDDLFSDDINYHYVMDPFRDSMTYSIIKLVKKYKNIYTDISALNYKIVDTGLALAWIFAFDAAGKFDAACKSDAEEEYKLMDKILWGSDYPMPLRTLDSYGEIFSEFRKWFRFRNYKYRYDEPGTNPDYRDGLPDPDELLENLIDRNPKKFLFG